MKILLLNENPVVKKLVTLSAQKTSDELEIARSVDEIEGKEYDFVVVDDALYGEDFVARLREKITYNKSLLICAKEEEEHAKEFSSILKKPFFAYRFSRDIFDYR